MELKHQEITGKIIGAAIEVHRVLGPGLLESAYERCLCRELELREIPYRRQVELPFDFKGFEIDCGYRMDVLVVDEVVVELKAVERLSPLDRAQLLTYLKLAKKDVGVLMNFNVAVLKAGIERFVL